MLNIITFLFQSDLLLVIASKDAASWGCNTDKYWWRDKGIEMVLVVDYDWSRNIKGIFMVQNSPSTFMFLSVLGFCNVNTMSSSVYEVLKHEAQPSVLGLGITRIANFVNYLKNFTVYLPILALIFSLQVILAKRIGRKI